MVGVTEPAPRLRVAAIGIVCFSLFAALFSRLYYLQILDGPSLEEVRGVLAPLPVRYQGERGRILDRYGRVLVDSREAISLTIDRRVFNSLTVERQDELLARLASKLNAEGVATKVSDIRARLADRRYDQFKPVPVAEDVSSELEAYLIERRLEYPSVDAERVHQRIYPQGSTAAHVLGYVSAISDDEFKARRKGSPKPYEPADEIGKNGVERIYEEDLRGTPGVRLVKVDNRNIEVSSTPLEPPKAGDDLQLTIDADLQRRVEALLPAALGEARAQKKKQPTDPGFKAPAASVVVLDVRTGEVLAMASYPTYAPSEFVGGISNFRFAELTDPAAQGPLNNRVVNGAYAPGSTFKLITAFASLSRGLISANDVWKDKGFYTLERCEAHSGAGCEFQNAGREVFGDVDMQRALKVSSDTYFYRLGELSWDRRADLGQKPFQDAAHAFGLGEPTGIQLPSEEAGLVADPALFKKRSQDNPTAFPPEFSDWFTGNSVNLAIGQEAVLTSPLQLANAYATFANGGTVLASSVAKAVVDHETGESKRAFDRRVLKSTPLPASVRDPILAGLTGAVSEPEGTAYEAFQGFPLDRFPIAGKTGTAEVVGPNGKLLADTAIFAAFGPVESPRYAVVAVVEEAGFASKTAAPLVRRVFEQLPELRKPDAEPALPIPTRAAPPKNGNAPVTSTPVRPGPASDVSVAPVSPTTPPLPPTSGVSAPTTSPGSVTTLPPVATATTNPPPTTALPSTTTAVASTTTPTTLRPPETTVREATTTTTAAAAAAARDPVSPARPGGG